MRKIKSLLFGNLALGHLKRNEVDEAEFYNSSCLSYDEANVKAHYRVIQIHLERNRVAEAQMYAIKCVSRFKDEASFKEALKDVERTHMDRTIKIVQAKPLAEK